jgi:hypothetical protein
MWRFYHIGALQGASIIALPNKPFRHHATPIDKALPGTA